MHNLIPLMHLESPYLSEEALMLQEQAKECYAFIIEIVRTNQELFRDEIDVMRD